MIWTDAGHDTTTPRPFPSHKLSARRAMAFRIPTAQREHNQYLLSINGRTEKHDLFEMRYPHFRGLFLGTTEKNQERKFRLRRRMQVCSSLFLLSLFLFCLVVLSFRCLIFWVSRRSHTFFFDPFLLLLGRFLRGRLTLDSFLSAPPFLFFIFSSHSVLGGF